MFQYNNVIVIDLASYGSAYAIINRFCDDDQVKVFEISPIGTAALLILTLKDVITAEILVKEIQSFFKSQVLSIKLIQNIYVDVLNCYLSQLHQELKSYLFIQEFSFASDAFVVAQSLIQQKIQLIDFRIVRTFPMNVVLISTSEDYFDILKISENNQCRHAQIIEKPTETLRDYFRISPN